MWRRLCRAETDDPLVSIVAHVARIAVLEDDRKLLGKDGLIFFDARDFAQVGCRDERREKPLEFPQLQSRPHTTA